MLLISPHLIIGLGRSLSGGYWSHKAPIMKPEDLLTKQAIDAPQQLVEALKKQGEAINDLISKNRK